jgi:hypothetical protein
MHSLTHFCDATVEWQLLRRQTFAFMDYEIHELFTQNQRLEFLGDALLEFITSSHLFLLVSRISSLFLLWRNNNQSIILFILIFELTYRLSFSVASRSSRRRALTL